MAINLDTLYPTIRETELPVTLLPYVQHDYAPPAQPIDRYECAATVHRYSSFVSFGCRKIPSVFFLDAIFSSKSHKVGICDIVVECDTILVLAGYAGQIDHPVPIHFSDFPPISFDHPTSAFRCDPLRSPIR